MCLMVGTTLQAVAGTDAFPNLPAGATVPPFRLGGLSTVISIGTFSQIFHYGLPLLVAPIKDKSKVAAAACSCCVWSLQHCHVGGQYGAWRTLYHVPDVHTAWIGTIHCG